MNLNLYLFMYVYLSGLPAGSCAELDLPSTGIAVGKGRAGDL